MRRRRAVALGKFDALHLGHRALAAAAARQAGEATLITFSGMAEVLGWTPRLPLLGVVERQRVLAQWSRSLGAPVTEQVLPFAELRLLSAGAFLELLAQAHAVGAIAVGEDFRCGHGRAAGVAELAGLCAERGLQLEVVPPVRIGGEIASSSGVRVHLAEGAVGAAAALLGRWYRLQGTVVPGAGRGRTIGVPTANCGALENQPPAAGVYAGRAWIGAAADGDRGIPAAINVGHAPTIPGSRPLTVEAHLIGWSGDCYGRPLSLALIERLRPEQRFADVAQLRAQLARDIAQAAAISERAQEPAAQEPA